MTAGSFSDALVGATDPTDVPDPEESTGEVAARSPLRLAWNRLKRDRGAMISLGVIVFIVLIAIFAPVFAKITGHPPATQYYGPDARNPVTNLTVGPNSHFWFGVDNLGRDVLVRVAYGARVSLEVGLGATAVTIVVGLVMGLLAGYFGGFVDTVIARIIDVVLAVPYLLFAIALIGVVGSGSASISLLIFIIASFGWASVARIIRGQVISLREKEFVEAARSLGAGHLRIMFVDLLPNVIAPAIVFSTLLIPVSVVTEAALSFLGIGIQAPTADWGQMINDASGDFTYAWWYLLFPSLALLGTTLAFNIFGDGVRDAFDPRSDRLILPKLSRRARRRARDARKAAEADGAGSTNSDRDENLQ